MTRRLTGLLCAVALAVGSAAARQPPLVEAGGVRLVNPFFFAESFGGSIRGRSIDTEWTLQVNGRTLRLLVDSVGAYLDGRRITLSAPVAYARGTLLAPYDDLLSLLEVPDPAISPGGTVVFRADTPERPAQQDLTSTQETRTDAPPSEPVPAGPPEVLTFNAAKSSAPLDTRALATPGFEVPLGQTQLSNELVARACQEAVTHTVGQADGQVRFARAFLSAHPQDAFSVRGTVTLTSSERTATRPFTCLAQRRDGRLLLVVNL